jgi:hypothetical protein
VETLNSAAGSLHVGANGYQLIRLPDSGTFVLEDDEDFVVLGRDNIAATPPNAQAQRVSR